MSFDPATSKPAPVYASLIKSRLVILFLAIFQLYKETEFVSEQPDSAPLKSFVEQEQRLLEVSWVITRELSASRLHATLFVNRRGFGRRQVAQECLRGLGFLRVRGNKAHQNRRSRNLARQRADHLDTGLGDDFTDEGQADVNVAFGEQFHRTSAALGDFDLRLHRIGNAKFLKRLVEADACSRTTRCVGIGYGVRT